jgi:hypothetical protein
MFRLYQGFNLSEIVHDVVVVLVIFFQSLAQLEEPVEEAPDAQQGIPKLMGYAVRRYLKLYTIQSQKAKGNDPKEDANIGQNDEARKHIDTGEVSRKLTSCQRSGNSWRVQCSHLYPSGPIL